MTSTLAKKILMGMTPAIGCVALTAQSVDWIETFDDPALLGSWKQSSSEPGYTLSQSTVDPFEGSASTVWSFDFATDAEDSSNTVWGGSVHLAGPGGGYDFSASSGIAFQYRINEQITGADSIRFVFKLIDSSDGVQEQWSTNCPALLDAVSTEWQEVKIPFENFRLPSWRPQGNGQLDIDQVDNWQMEIIAETGGTVSVVSGEIELDALSLYATPFYGAVAEDFDDLFGLGTLKNTSSTPGVEISLDTIDPYDGTAAVKMDYSFVADAGVGEQEIWGGSVTLAGPGSGFDFGTAAGLVLRYKTTMPLSETTPAVLNFKLVDNSSGVTEYWQESFNQPLVDTSGEWMELIIPFSGFSLLPWSPQGNGQLDLDAIANWQIEVYVGGEGAEETFTGAIEFDDLQTYTTPSFVRTIEDFDTPSNYAVWKQTGSEPGITLSKETTDVFEGAASTKIDYAFVADKEWGGSVNLAGFGGGYDLSAGNAIGLHYKVTEPTSGDNSLWFVFKLVDTSNGVSEYWEWKSATILSSESDEWQFIALPLSEFTLPDYLPGRGNEELDPDAVVNWEVELRASGPSTALSQGSILLDGLALYSDAAPTVGPGVFSQFPLVEGRYVNAGDWGGWVLVERYPWVYFYDLGTYAYVSGQSGDNQLGWVYFPFSGTSQPAGPSMGPGVLDVFPMADETNLFAENWLGWLEVAKYPWIYSYGFKAYVFVSPSAEWPGWIYHP